MELSAAVDVGGTYTDLIYLKRTSDQDVVKMIKVDTTGPNYDQGIINSLHAANLKTSEINRFYHGTTSIINAITQRKGAIVGLITTLGFRDVLEIGRSNRPDFFNLNFQKPIPFVPRYLRKELPGRMTFEGIERISMDFTQLPQIIDYFINNNVNSIAICFINAYKNPLHEIQTVQKIQEELVKRKLEDKIEVSASYEISREWREFERTSTVVISAYVKPITLKYLDQLQKSLISDGFQEQNLSNIYIMQSNCGVDSIEMSKKTPIKLVESGPASGIQGAAYVGKHCLGIKDIIALDIGGTTAKCSLINNSQIQIKTEYYIEKNKIQSGFPIQMPVIDIVEVGQGGGSKAWVDQFSETLKVGPDSAGSNPGPVAYQKGNIDDTTTTDANLLLGRINSSFFAGGSIKVDMQKVADSTKKIINQLKIQCNAENVAEMILRVANNNVVKALKLISIDRGYDPRDFALMAFGGGGGLHAAYLARELRIKQVIVPRFSSVFSSYGMLLCDIRRDFIMSQQLYFPNTQDEIEVRLIKITHFYIQHFFKQQFILKTLNQCFLELENSALLQFGQSNKDQPKKIIFQRSGFFHYENQSHSLESEIPNDEILNQSSIKIILRQFHNNHKQKYKYQLENNAIILESLHLVAIQEVEKIKPAKININLNKGNIKVAKRYVNFGKEFGVFNETNIFCAETLYAGFSTEGPAIIEDTNCQSSIIIPPGSIAKIDDYGNTLITIIYDEKLFQIHSLDQNTINDRLTLDIIYSTLDSISEEMFTNIGKTAMSSIITEIFDMGVCITDMEGKLVTSGFGIPPFVCITDQAIRSIVQQRSNDISEGDMYLVNSPYSGGITHLNDFVFAMPVHYNGKLVSWVGAIAHQIDIGGSQPGSLNPFSTEIFQEGLIIPVIKIYSKGILNEEIIKLILANSRTPINLNGDMNAMMNALKIGNERIIELFKKYSESTVIQSMKTFIDTEKQKILHGLKGFQTKQFSYQYPIEGKEQCIYVDCEINQNNFIIDLKKNLPVKQVNAFNQQKEVTFVTAALIMKSLASPERSGNFGSFIPLQLSTTPGSQFDAIFPMAQGFYYEQMIILYDIILKALANKHPEKLTAGSFSTIYFFQVFLKNNITKQLGIVTSMPPGGWGASKNCDGCSCLYTQVHGDTFNCPIEVSEATAPVYIEKCTFNDAYGGEGQFIGGRGIIMEWKFKENKTFLTLDSRKQIPWGLNGGLDGSENSVTVIRQGDPQNQQKYYSIQNLELNQNDIIQMRTSNGGGYGDPKLRDRNAVKLDIKNEYITKEYAKEIYNYFE